MFTYILMNLFKTPWRSLQLILGSFIVFLLVLTAWSLQKGMQASLNISGDDKNVILLGRGSEDSLERSEISWNAVIAARTIPGLKKYFGEPAVAPEIYFNSLIQVNGKSHEAMLRGMQSNSFNVYPNIELLEGDFPVSGQVMVGRLTWKRLGLSKEDLKIGKEIVFERKTLKVSGIFTAPGSFMESEIWIPINDLKALSQRESISAITVRLDDAEFEDIDLFTKSRLDLELTAIREKEYYNKVNQYYQPIRFMTWVTTILIAAGAFFGGLNTYYAAIQNRSKELATLQAIGYSRLRLFFAILGESLLLHSIALFLALLTALFVFPQIHLNFGLTFFSLVLDSSMMAGTIGVSLLLSLFEILLPAWSCFSPPLNKTLTD